MEVGLQDMGDAHPHALGRGQIFFHIPLGIDDGAGTLAPQQIGEVGKPGNKKRLHKHGRSSFFVSGGQEGSAKEYENGCLFIVIRDPEKGNPEFQADFRSELSQNF
jgi:hypothetical protein